MLIIRSSLHCVHFLCLPGVTTALPVVKVTRKLDKPLDVMSQFQSIICACVEGWLITELQILAMMGTSRDDMCVYLPLCLISKLNQKEHKGNSVFYQPAANLEQPKR